MKLTPLVVTGLDRSLTQWFEGPSPMTTPCMRFDDKYGTENPLRDQSRPWMARIRSNLSPSQVGSGER